VAGVSSAEDDDRPADRFDCQACGACCRAEPPYGGGMYVRLEDGDAERLGPVGRRLTVLAPEGGLAMRLVRNRRGDEVCIALTGTIGKRVACGIYDLRPTPCRDFEAGSPECRLARVEAGLDPDPGDDD
jgi:Fe-S-cluster containining protein